MWLALGVVAPVAGVWLAVRAARLGVPTLLHLAFAMAGGLGLSSVLTFWVLNLGVRLDDRFVVGDAAVWALVCAVGWWLGRGATHGAVAPREVASSLERSARAVFVLMLMVTAATVVAHVRVAPYGEWDAWAIWNQKARFLLRGGPEHWAEAMRIPWSNASHPLLVSGTVARLWAYAGGEAPLVPAMVSAMFALSIACGLTGALAGEGATRWVAGSVVLAPAVFPQLAAAQTADLPVATFIALSVAAFRRDDLGPSAPSTRRWLVMAGLFAGLAAWTKNEGVVFLAAAGAFAAWRLLRRQRLVDLTYVVAGAVPALLTVAWFKLGLAPDVPAYGTATRLTTAEVVMRLTSVDGHLTLARLAARMVPAWGGPMAPASLLFAVAGAAASALAGSGTARLVLTAAGVVVPVFYATILVLPYDTTWMFSTTFERFSFQLWPSLVLAACSWRDARLSRAVPVRGHA